MNDLTEPLKAAKEPPRPQTRPSLFEVRRESNFTDVIPMYEMVDPETGAGHGLYTTVEEARKNALRTDLIASAVYTLTDEIRYVEQDEPKVTGSTQTE